MAPNRGTGVPNDQADYPSSDADSFKSFEPDEQDHDPSTTSPASKNQQPEAKKPTTLKPTPSPSEQQQPDFKPTSPPSLTNRDRLPPAEESSLLAESTALKLRANTLFSTGSHENALQTYEQALALCPAYLDYEVAVLRANIAACNLKLSAWPAAADAAGKGLECLERLERLPVVREKDPRAQGQGQGQGAKEEVVEEVDDELEARIENLRQSGHTLSEVRKLQAKLLTRRAQAKTAQGGWAELQGAAEDYRVLLSPGMAGALGAGDRKRVEGSAAALRPRLDEAREREMAEMMGKLKGLGNSFLKPFGLSTENFKFQKDEKSGGYSMNFEQNPGK